MRVYNIKFMNYIATGGDCLFFRQSTAYNCIFDNFNGLNHCLHFGGSNPFSLCAYNCTFSNSKVTFGGRDADSGQYMTIANAIMDKCNFINLTSQHHSAALCISPLWLSRYLPPPERRSWTAARSRTARTHTQRCSL